MQRFHMVEKPEKHEWLVPDTACLCSLFSLACSSLLLRSGGPNYRLSNCARKRQEKQGTKTCGNSLLKYTEGGDKTSQYSYLVVILSNWRVPRRAAGPGLFPREFRSNSERLPSSEQIPGKFRQVPGKFLANFGQASQTPLTSLII